MTIPKPFIIFSLDSFAVGLFPHFTVIILLHTILWQILQIVIYLFIYFSYEGLNSFCGKYNWVPDKQSTDLFVMEKLGEGKSHILYNIMTLRRERKNGRHSMPLQESNT